MFLHEDHLFDFRAEGPREAVEGAGLHIPGIRFAWRTERFLRLLEESPGLVMLAPHDARGAGEA
jgi:hypothetical protein